MPAVRKRAARAMRKSSKPFMGRAISIFCYCSTSAAGKATFATGIGQAHAPPAAPGHAAGLEKALSPAPKRGGAGLRGIQPGRTPPKNPKTAGGLARENRGRLGGRAGGEVPAPGLGRGGGFRASDRGRFLAVPLLGV